MQSWKCSYCKFSLVFLWCAGIPADRQGRAGSPQRVDRAHNTWLLTRERLWWGRLCRETFSPSPFNLVISDGTSPSTFWKHRLVVSLLCHGCMCSLSSSSQLLIATFSVKMECCLIRVSWVLPFCLFFLVWPFLGSSIFKTGRRITFTVETG